MTEIRDRTFFGGEPVETDGVKFIDCRFEDASLRYAGGEIPFFQDCTFVEFGWYFHGPALRTIQLLQGMNNAGGQDFIAYLFQPGNVIGE